ncbi:hypothetical protein TWF694_002508 [Orbilia ellipsospora]|uniref:SRP9 domain-containing protein n=1 Tax=Orbilia ellipsospora TaxID=2528407 RepID=A0AAV9X4Q2_9PEZI
MVKVHTPLEFIERSLQLLQAHPNTTKITTTYHISPPPTKPSRHPKPTSTKSTATATTTEEKPKLPRGKLTLKTYDPISGGIIIFKTEKVADMGRLVGGLHRLGRRMANVKDIIPDDTAAAATAGGGTATPTATGGSTVVSKDAVAGAVVGASGAGEEGSAAGGSKGGKKKNKKKK